jgi:Flp pilus assembly protein TadD
MATVSREAIERRVRALVDLGREAAARDETLKALAGDPRDPVLLELLGLCLVRLGAARDAEAALGDAVAAAPSTSPRSRRAKASR